MLTLSQFASGPRRFARAWTALVSLALLMTLAGCGGGVRATVGRSPEAAPAQRAAIDHDAYATLGYRLSWQGYPMMGPRGRTQYVDVLDEGVLIHSSNNVMTFVERSTGANRWVREVGPPITRFVGNIVNNGQLLVSSDNELFMMDLRTGEVVDKDSLAIVVSTKPVVIGPLVIYGSGSGEILAHNLETGFKLWGYQLRGAIEAPPVALGERVGVVSQLGDVIVINTRNGSSTLRARIFGGLANDPVAGEDSMYVASLDQSIYGFAARGSSWDWRVRTDQPLSEQPVLLDGVLYVDIPGEGLTALDPAYNGERIWTSPEVSGRVVGMTDGDLLVWSESAATAYLLDTDTGDVIAQERLNGVERMQMAPTTDGELFTVSRTGAVNKFVPRL